MINATTPMPTDGMTGAPCITNHYCPGGTADPLPCPDGTYMTDTHADQCLPCPGGHYCTTGGTPESCPAGYFCPEGTGEVWQSCPTGTFSTAVGLYNDSQCTSCTPGSYCASPNATTVTGDCSAGYYCVEGSDTPTPDNNYKGTAGPCPTGHYCPSITSVPLKCPRGTYSNVTRLRQSSECEPCDYGMYCGDDGLTSPTGECWAGFFCLRRSQTPNNPVVDATGGPCPMGHYCHNGTSYPLGCPPGTYNPTTGLSACLTCPVGYFCPENSTDYSIYPCPTGHYCPAGTSHATEYPCDLGYYNNYTGKGAKSDCIPCEPRMYCATPGLSYPTGLCAEGWYCSRGAWSDRPITLGNATTNDTCFCPSDVTGGKCQPGEFCPVGSHAPLPCTPGHYCDRTELASNVGPCSAGHYCTLGAWRPDPLDGTTGDLCPKGHYCPEATAVPNPCPPGSFSNATGNQAVGDCLPCTPGRYCRLRAE